MSQGFISRRGGVGGGDSNTAFKAFVSGTLTNITADMLEGCTAIGKYTFYHYESLISVNIPESVTLIGERSFDSCIALTSINIPNSVTTINSYAFRYCSALISATIGNGITSIGDNVFYYCTSITSLTVKAATPPSLGVGTIMNAPESFTIYVPASSVDAYKAATNWSTYASIIQAIP